MAVLTLLCWRAVLDRSAGDRGLLTEGEKGPPCSSGRSLDKGETPEWRSCRALGPFPARLVWHYCKQNSRQKENSDWLRQTRRLIFNFFAVSRSWWVVSSECFLKDNYLNRNVEIWSIDSKPREGEVKWKSEDLLFHSFTHGRFIPPECLFRSVAGHDKEYGCCCVERLWTQQNLHVLYRTLRIV